MTEEERRIWNALRSWRDQGFHFRRQAPIGPYIVDFACHKYQLAIEIDGSQHGWDRERQRDDKRDQWPRGEAYEVLRFWNNEVRDNLDGVLDRIHEAISELKRQRAIEK